MILKYTSICPTDQIAVTDPTELSDHPVISEAQGRRYPVARM